MADRKGLEVNRIYLVRYNGDEIVLGISGFNYDGSLYGYTYDESGAVLGWVASMKTDALENLGQVLWSPLTLQWTPIPELRN